MVSTVSNYSRSELCTLTFVKDLSTFYLSLNAGPARGCILVAESKKMERFPIFTL